MFDCLDIILNSYHCKLNITENNNNHKNIDILKDDIGLDGKALPKKEKLKYFYFIGAGNNANLIRSLMRKRSWWAEVDNISKANFVWTQLRIQNVLEKLQQH